MKLLLSIFATLVFFACAPQKPVTTEQMRNHAAATLQTVCEGNSFVKKIASHAYAYVIYPHVGKGAVGIGGAYGKGEVYERTALSDRLVGYSELTQISAGLQLGGQTFGEMIFFETRESFEKFKRGGMKFSVGVSGVAFEGGIAARAFHEEGYAVVIFSQKGLMGELSLGGQELSFRPL